MDSHRILRRRDVESLTGLSRSSLYAAISKGLITPPVAIGDRTVGWPEREVVAVNDARIRGASRQEVRELVDRLVEERTGQASPAAP